MPPKISIDLTARDKTKAAFKSVSKGLDRIKSLSLSISKPLGLIGGVGVAGIAAMAKSAIDLGSELSDVATRLSINSEEFQTLREAALDAGASAEIMQRALRNVKNRTEQAAAGAKNYQTSLKTLGLATSDVVGLPLAQRFETIARAYSQAENEAQAFVAVQSLIGEEAGPALVEVLNRISSEGLANLQSDFKTAGRIMSDETQTALDRASDAIRQFNQKATIKIGSIVADVTQGDFDSLAQGMEDAAGKFWESWDKAIPVMVGRFTDRVRASIIASETVAAERQTATERAGGFFKDVLKFANVPNLIAGVIAERAAGEQFAGLGSEEIFKRLQEARDPTQAAIDKMRRELATETGDAVGAATANALKEGDYTATFTPREEPTGQQVVDKINDTLKQLVPDTEPDTAQEEKRLNVQTAGFADKVRLAQQAVTEKADKQREEIKTELVKQTGLLSGLSLAGGGTFG